MTMQHLINLSDFEEAAREAIPKMAFDYYAGGANDGITLQENRRAYDRLSLAPRVLVDVSRIQTETVILGQKSLYPVIIAPMAMAAMAHPAAENAIARAAHAAGIPMTLSTMATTSLEDVAQATANPLWFQLYMYKDRAITQRMIQRAEAAGCAAIVLTVDVPIAGRRERDERNQFRLPPGIVLSNLSEFMLETVGEGDAGSSIAAYVATQLDPSLTWHDVDWLCSITRLPVLVKGILRADDALRAIEHGVQGIIVSNHGGRQLDTAPATIDVLPKIAQAVDGRVDVIVDGGIRRGTDIVKAVAAGARAVMVGRPVMWGLGVGGEDGVRRVLHLLHGELENAMMLCGCSNIEDITPDLLL